MSNKSRTILLIKEVEAIISSMASHNTFFFIGVKNHIQLLTQLKTKINDKSKVIIIINTANNPACPLTIVLSFIVPFNK